MGNSFFVCGHPYGSPNRRADTIRPYDIKEFQKSKSLLGEKKYYKTRHKQYAVNADKVGAATCRPLYNRIYPPYEKSLPVTHITGVCWRIKRSSAGAINLA